MDKITLDEYQKAIAPKHVEVGFRYFFVVNQSGDRTQCFGPYGEGNRQRAEVACELGEHVEGRNCPYRGCREDPSAQPPCPLCYE